MKDVLRRPQNLFNQNNNVQGTFMTITHPLTVSRTGEAPAKLEVHGLHAHGEHDLVNSAYGKEGTER